MPGACRCGYRTEFFLNAGEDALQIVLYYKKGRYPGYDVFSEKKIEIKNNTIVNKLKKFFTNSDMKVLISHQTNFISQALGGPKEYTGLDMKTAHQGMKISQEDFNGVAGHLKQTLEELNVESQDVDTIIGVVAPLSEHIVSK